MRENRIYHTYPQAQFITDAVSVKTCDQRGTDAEPTRIVFQHTQTKWFQSRPECADHSVVIAAQRVDSESPTLSLQVIRSGFSDADSRSAVSARNGRS